MRAIQRFEMVGIITSTAHATNYIGVCTIIRKCVAAIYQAGLIWCFRINAEWRPCCVRMKLSTTRCGINIQIIQIIAWDALRLVF